VSRELSQGPAIDALVQAQVDIGKLEVEVQNLRDDIIDLKKLVEQLNTQMTKVTAQLSEAKGGWRMLMLLGGAAASLGAGVTWLITHMKIGP